jgi:hypothetical protein
MFNLEQSIVEWRWQMRAGGIKAPELLDELEGHLREEWTQLVKSGLSHEKAFENAAAQIGRGTLLHEEFAKAQGLKWMEKLSALLGFNKTSSLEDLSLWSLPAQQSLALAVISARSFHNNYVGTEHILLGLIKSKSPVVLNLLRRLGVDEQAILIEIEKIVGAGQVHEVPAQIPYTPRGKKAPCLAFNEARMLNHSRVNPGHILLGLILVRSGVALQALSHLGVRLENTRRELLVEMQANPGLA